MHFAGGEECSRSISTCYKTYNMLEIKDIIKQVRAVEVADGKPKREVFPVSSYLLEELIHKFFKEYAPRGAVLEKIIMRDTKYDGI